ncbi:TIGR02234 family membrane protein [Nocardia camponoti]|uniref:Membrane protein n=1 Tax=Nocardia camponoti TaxID=1616106 RepID=A0A917QUB1_9NOCA|nr:TIGR02234 family membrane protein [Nocardia camponoti]GGK68239.1 membrane protein [Nocardia camponoti]
MSSEAQKSAKPVLAVVLLALAAAGLWASSRMTWVTVSSEDGLTDARVDQVDGSTWFGALTPIALVLLASIAAVFALKGALRQLLGVVIAVLAAVAAVPGFAITIGEGNPSARAGQLLDLRAGAVITSAETHVFPALLSLVAAACALAAGIALTRSAKKATADEGLSSKYDNPAARREEAKAAVEEGDDTAPLSDRVLWDALDAGTDPTDPDNHQRGS